MANASTFETLNYFEPEEFDHPELVDEAFIQWLDVARYFAGVPFIVTSDARTLAENAAVGGWERSLHLQGRAVDLRWPNREQLFAMLAGIFVTRYMAPGNLQVELEVTPGNEHIHVGCFPPGDGAEEFFVECSHRGG
jgi:hypothetical protein